MAGYDYDYSRRVLRGEGVDEWDPRYFDSHGNLRESYQSQPYTTHTTHTTQLVPRGREDSGLSAESGRRDLVVPGERDVRRTRSAEPGYVHEDYEYRRSYGPRHDSRYDREYDREYERRVRRGDRYYEDDNRSERSERKQRHSSGLSTQEKIIAAVAGAALLAGGKELYDRREAKEEGTDVHRNPLASAALAGFGALAAYQGAEFYSKQQAKKDRKANYILHRGRDGEISEYYSDDEDYNSKEKKGHKNFLENALAATGLGAVVKNLTGVGDDRRSETRSRGGSPTPSRASSRGGKGHNKVQKAAIASLLAGATEAFRVAKEPGGWRGEKTKRILTAAAGAATVDAAHGADHGKLGLAESVIGGLVGNRLINGSKNDIEEDKLTGRSRSRSRARSRGSGSGGGPGLAALATAGLGALGAKKALDRSRSRSRGRGNYDSRSPSRDRRYERSRSRSVVDKARDSLAKLGIGSGTMVPVDENRRRDRDSSYDQGSRRPHRRDDSYDGDRGYRRNRSRGSDRGHRDRSGDRSRDRYERSDRRERRSGYGSESDLGDSDEDEKRAKKMRDHRRY